MRRLARNLARISMPCVRVAAIVVSEMSERLSPNIAPPTTEPTISAGSMPSGPTSPAAIGTSAAIVPQLVPIASETSEETRNMPASMKRAGTSACAMATAASTAPEPFAIVANDPARMNTMHMIMMFGSPIEAA